MSIFSGRKSIVIKVSVLVVSFVFAFSILFLAFPAKAFASDTENVVSAEETSVNDIDNVEAKESADDNIVSDGDSTVSSTDEVETANEEVSQTDDTSSSDAVVEDGQDQADNASDAGINSEDEEALQNQEFIEEEQPEDIADELNSDDENITDSEEGIISEEAGEAITAEESIKEEIAEDNEAEDVLNTEEETSGEELQTIPPEINIDILFSTDEDGYIPAGEETNFGIDLEGIDIEECYWDFGDGSDSLDKNPSHTYKKDGNYTQTVTIVDSEGNSYSKTTTVHVSDHNPYTTEWYVSPDAVSNAGDFEDGNSSENPVSIDSVLSHIVDGDTLYFLPGTYTGTYTEDKSSNISLDNIGTGTEDNPISFVGYDQAIFDGGNTIDHAFSLTSPLSYLGFYNFTFINYLDSAIYIDNEEVTNIDIVDSTFADNNTAIDVTMDSDLNIQNNIIVNNNVGIDVSSDNANIEHNIVVDNSGGIKVDDTKGNVVVDYNDVYNNQEDYIGTEPGENDVSVDPMFADKEALDFSLQEDSPLLNSNIIRIVQTDKEDYRYNEQVIITGSGYSPNQELILKILRPDGTFVEYVAVTTDINGSFVYDGYSIDYAGKNYLIKITNIDGNILEVLSFTDKTITVDTSKPVEGDNYHTIQDAIDAASAGDTINVAAGTYAEDAYAWVDIQINKSLSLIGAGSSLTTIEFNEKTDGLGIGASDVLIQGIKLTKKGTIGAGFNIRAGVNVESAPPNNTFSNITLRDIESEYSGGQNICFDGGYTFENIILENCNIHNSGEKGFYLPSGTEINTLTVADSIFHHNGYPVGTGSDEAGFVIHGPTTNITMTNCKAYDNKSTGFYFLNVNTTGGFTNTLTNIQSYDNGRRGIAFKSSSNFILDGENLVADNGIEKDGTGFYIYEGSDNIKITNCTITGNSPGIVIKDASNITINSCKIYNNDDDHSKWGSYVNGILVTDAYTETDNIDATKNWWGYDSGPTHTSNPDGTGDTVSDNVDYSPWLGAIPGTSPMTWYTNDSIQDAVNAATGGDTINVVAGTYVEYTGAVSAGCAIDIPWFAEGAGGLTIQGAGAENTIIDCGWAGSGVKIVSNDITFTGFTVKNAYTVVGQVSAQNHTLSNLIISDFVNVGLELMAVHNCTFSNITIHTNDVSKSEDRTVKGIDMQEYGSGGNTNNTFQDITIYDIKTTGTYGTSMGIFWEGDNQAAHPTTNNTFTNVTIYNMIGPWIGAGIYMYGGDSSQASIVDTTFSGGSIYNCDSIGIYVLGGCKNLSISGFDITNNGIHGIGIRHYYGTACENIDINFNNIVGHTVGYGVKNYNADNDVDATSNWWGDASGPSGVGPGTAGDAVSNNVDYDPWLGASLESTTQETTASGDVTIDAIDEVGVEVEKTGTGTPTVTVAKYSENPDSGFSNDLGVYTDLHINDATNVDQIVFRMYYTDADVAAAGLQEGTLKARWWDGSQWIECSNQTVNTAGNYIEVIINNIDTSPLLSDLTGTPFAASGSAAVSVAAAVSVEEEEEEAKPKPKPWERTDTGYYEKTDTGFTTLFYSRFFSRPPDQAGLDSWVAWLVSGAINSAELVNGFIFGEECQTRISDYTSTEFITFLYQVLFNRAPEDYGFNAWTTRMNAGMTKGEVVDRFTHSEEFVSFCILFGIMPYEGYVSTEE